MSLYSLHPEPTQIFQLWQMYLENVDPMLKVTHSPSLQARIIGAISNLHQLDPNLEALMFSIYCIAIQSVDEAACIANLYTPRDELLMRYRFGCRQALLRSGYLRTHNRDCLTALFVYLVNGLL